jgi:ABC-2 type transport system permease protein
MRALTNSLTNVLAIARRELASYYTSIVGYVVTFFFLIVNGVWFYLGLASQQQDASLRPVVGTLLTIFLLLSPILSMRLLAEEQRAGTLELLLTAPVRDGEVAIGKFLAALGFLAVMLVLTLAYPAVLFIYGRPDPGELFGGYLAMLLFGAAAMAVGLFASSLTQNQIVAAVISWAVFLVLWVFDGAAQFVGGTFGEVLRYLAMFPHLNDMTRGVVNTKDVVYYLSLVVGALFLTTRSLEARRWRG